MKLTRLFLSYIILFVFANVLTLAEESISMAFPTNLRQHRKRKQTPTSEALE